MYFPILRGRQFELLAIRECLEKDLLSNQIIPIIEPVKASSTFIRTLEMFHEKQRKISVISNPSVGAWDKEVERDTGQGILERYEKLLCESPYVVPAFYAKNAELDAIGAVQDSFAAAGKVILIFKSSDDALFKEAAAVDDLHFLNLIPDNSVFRRKFHNPAARVICQDHFNRRERNDDYATCPDEAFSEDHLYCKDDGYGGGFSDYSIIGDYYAETGFAPFAIAIHIIVPEITNELRIKHFVSDSNDDISDPAGKFEEALGKLMIWYEAHGKRFETEGLAGFVRCQKEKVYPGLGTVKKLAIMHHLELIGRFLESGQFMRY